MKFRIAISLLIFFFGFSANVISAGKSGKNEEEITYNLTPVYRVGMIFEEKHTFDVSCDTRSDGKRFKYDDDNASIFKGETKLNYEIINKDKLKIEFKKVSGTPFNEKDAEKEKALLVLKKNLKSVWVETKFTDLSDITEKSVKLEKAIKKSLAKKAKYTEEDLVKSILSRPLDLYVSPKNDVNLGDSWQGEIPSCYQNFQLGKTVKYYLESVKKKGKKKIAIIKMLTEINESNTNGGQTVATNHKASGSIKFDVTNKVVNEMSFKLDYSCRTKLIYSHLEFKKYSMSVTYDYENYGTDEIENKKNGEDNK